MYGFNNGISMLQDLASHSDIIAVQEHWLMEDDFVKFSLLSNTHQYKAVTPMTAKSQDGLLRGRPFGGIAIYGVIV